MPPGRRRRTNINLLVPFFVIALVFGGLIWQKYQASREVPAEPHMQQPSGKRTAVLFFVAEGSRLAREARELEPCTEMTVCVKEVLQELFNGPVGDLDDVLPEGATLKSVRIEGDLAVVDVNHNFSNDLTLGSSAEMMAVYSIVNTVCSNFPLIKRVKLTVEGEQGTILQHLDLSDPLFPDYTLEQEPAPETAGKAVNPVKTK